jgi:hypothetical protein
MNQAITAHRPRRRSGLISHLAIFLAVSLAGVTAEAQTQTGIPLVPGTRVRVTATNMVAPIVGSFLEQRGDTAVFIEGGSGRGIWSLTLGQIIRLEQSAGEKRSNKPYLIKGAAFGAGAGLVASLLFLKAFSPDGTKEWDRTPSMIIGAVAGGGIGAAVGSRFAREHWSAVPLPRRVGLLPTRGGFKVGLGFEF